MNKDLLLFVLLNCFPTVRNIEYYSCSYYTILTGHYTENRQELKSRQASNVLMLNVVSGLEFVPPIVAECTRPARAVLPRVPTPGSQQPLSTIEVVARRSAVWTPPEPPSYLQFSSGLQMQRMQLTHILLQPLEEDSWNKNMLLRKFITLVYPLLNSLLRSLGLWFHKIKTLVPNSWWAVMDRWTRLYLLLRLCNTFARWFKNLMFLMGAEMLLQIFCIGLVAGVTSVNPLGSDNLGIWPAPAPAVLHRTSHGRQPGDPGCC